MRSVIGGMLLSLSVSTTLTAAPLTGLVVLGDSLSDGGNAFIALGGLTPPPLPVTAPPFPLIPDFPYVRPAPLLPALSNGPVWAEHLGAALGLPVLPALIPGGTNYAFAGADTGPLPLVPAGSSPTLSTQLGMFAAAGPIDPSALHAVWGGGNDLRRAMDVYAGTLIATGGDAAAAFAAAGAVVGAGVSNLASILTSLAAGGAKHILSLNAPDIGLAPALDFAPLPGATVLATGLSAMFNAGLASVIDGIEAAFLIDVIEVDVFSLLNAIVADPAAFHLTDATSTCLVPGTATVCSDPASFLFWDGIHPTTAGHRIIAGAAFVAAVPVTATPLLLAIGAFSLLFVVTRRRVRQVQPVPVGVSYMRKPAD